MNKPTNIVVVAASGRTDRPVSYMSFMGSKMRSFIRPEETRAKELVVPARFSAEKNHFEVLLGTGIKYCMVRVLELADSNSNINSELSLHDPTRTIVAMRQTAKALLRVARTDEWDGTAPLISK
jgi:hypothetical protein